MTIYLLVCVVAVLLYVVGGLLYLAGRRRRLRREASQRRPLIPQDRPNRVRLVDPPYPERPRTERFDWTRPDVR